MILLDCEASGLASKSYPIEIAWLNVATFEEDSFLINPFSCSTWDHWDHSAEQIHGLCVNELIEKGITVQEAAERLSGSLSGQKVYTDCPAHDYTWVQRLYSVANARMDVRFGDVFDLVHEPHYEEFGRQLRMHRRPHRALPDCYAIYNALEALPHGAFISSPMRKVLSQVS